MDDSETYIKMCDKAVKIQSHKTEFMDWYVCRTHHRVLEPDGMYYSEYGCPDSSLDPKSLIWLPRQDQLQEMIQSLYLNIWLLFAKFGRWCDEWGGDSGRFVTGEQLWLAFVMKEKYGKYWDGEDWKFAEPQSAAR